MSNNNSPLYNCIHCIVYVYGLYDFHINHNVKYFICEMQFVTLLSIAHNVYMNVKILKLTSLLDKSCLVFECLCYIDLTKITTMQYCYCNHALCDLELIVDNSNF